MKPKNDQDDLSEIVGGISCFAAHKESGKSCKKKSCRYWHDLKEHNNCTIIVLVPCVNYLMASLGYA